MTAAVTIACVALLLLFAYFLGRIHQQDRDRLMVPEPIADSYPDVPTDVRGQAAIAQEMVDTAAIELVAFTGTAPDPILALEPPVVDAPLLVVVEQRDRYRARFERADRLRLRYLRALRRKETAA